MVFMQEDFIRLGVSLALGTAIGLEREVSDKAAGLRTNVFIALGSTLFTLVSLRFPYDPARIAAQIVSGIGFIGAGSILREGERVTGLTTAATIWTVAAIGMAVGYGHFTLACLATAGALFIQLAFTNVDIWIDDIRERHNVRIVTRLDNAAMEEVSRIFREGKIRIMKKKLMKRQDTFVSEWRTSGSRDSQQRVLKRLLENPAVLEVTY